MLFARKYISGKIPQRISQVSNTCKRFFSVKESDEDYVVEEQPADKFKAQDYVFYDKNLALVVDNPLFPYSSRSLTLGPNHSKILSERMPAFVTTLLKKDLVDQLHYEETHDGKSILGKNVTNDFYTTGTYCSVEYNSEDANRIHIKGIHKINIKNVQEYILTTSGETEQSNFEKVMSELKSTHLENNSVLKPSNKFESMTAFLSNGIEAMRNDRKYKDDFDGRLYISEIEKFNLKKYRLDFNDRVKLEHMLAQKVMNHHNSNIFKENPLNYDDIELFLDMYAGMLVNSKFFTRDDLIPAFVEPDTKERLDIIHKLMKKFHLLMTNMNEIGMIAQKNMMMKQSKAYYQEIFEVLKTLSEGGKGNEKFMEKLSTLLQGKKMPKHVMTVYNENLKRLMSISGESSELSNLKGYLEWIASLPYGLISEDNFNIQNVKKLLDNEHFGLDDVKERILEFVSVGIMKKNLKEKILLLHGPPGVGKTSLAISIAKALNRKYARISLGGESDSSVLKGHRRTYIGAYPGKIINALKSCGSENCVIILDERLSAKIDKLGHGNHMGDPQSNLLEILDPSQNSTFVDNYLDFPIDLSKVLFICTANTTSTISPVLLDRMDTIQLSSYTNQEKEHIFKDHILDKAIRDAGLDPDLHNFEINDNIIEVLINDYCREPGVRSLERQVKKLAEKIAFKIVTEKKEKDQEGSVGSSEVCIKVNRDNLKEFLGKPIFESDIIYNNTPSMVWSKLTKTKGVVTGLAYTEYGGSVLFLESKKSTVTRDPTSGNLRTTGKLGEVMKESMQIAYTFAKNFLAKKGNHYLEKNDIHIHAPEGATPKDGPSAGVTIVSSLLSLAMDKPVRQKLGMTGEISLRGNVMKIGGIKEKVLAAKREGLTTVMCPESNREDVDELKDYVKEGIEFKFVENYDQAFDVVFSEANQVSNFDSMVEGKI